MVSNKEDVGSVHLSDFPSSISELIDNKLENKINQIRNICSLALSIRKKEKIKVRQPLNKIIIPTKNNHELKEIENAKSQILSEINVKSIEFLDNRDSLLVKELKPNFKRLGPRYGKIINKVSQEIRKLTNKEIEILESEGHITIVVENEKIHISNDDVEINYKDIEGLSVATDGKQTVALDLNLDEQLIDEGITREIVNRIQNIRKLSLIHI